MNEKDNLCIAWLFTSQMGNYWHPVLSEFTKVFKKTTVYTGYWSGFTTGFEDAFTVEEVGKTRCIKMAPSGAGYSRHFLYASPSIVGHLLQLKPQVIFTNGFSLWTFLALLFKPWGRWRLIVAWEGSSPTVDYCDSRLRIMSRRMIVRFADALITNNHRGKAYLTKILRAKESHVFARPYEVPDLKALSGQQEDSEASDLGLRRPVFLYVGQVIQRKGLHLLLEACVILQKQEYRNYTVLILGDGTQRDELENFSQNHGLKDCVKWVGWLDYEYLSYYFQSADVFVLPTLEDTWGMVVLEAMAFGKPVLCSKWAGAAEMVVEGENGYVFDPHDPAKLAETMRRFIDNPDLIVSMGHKSQQLITPHTPEAAAQFFAEVTYLALGN